MRKVYEQMQLIIKLRLQQQSLQDLYPNLTPKEVEELWAAAAALEQQVKSERDPTD